jgi:hypothetical protein
MKLVKREQVFEQHEKIAGLIKGFQDSFFDEMFDRVEDEMFDAIKLVAPKGNESWFNLMIYHKEINSYPQNLAGKLKALLRH